VLVHRTVLVIKWSRMPFRFQCQIVPRSLA
jgi:hypothetical protein